MAGVRVVFAVLAMVWACHGYYMKESEVEFDILDDGKYIYYAIFCVTTISVIQSTSTLRKHAYSNILKISKTENFQIKTDFFLIFLLKT